MEANLLRGATDAAPGDSRSLAGRSSSPRLKGWRGRWPLKQQVRAEKLRRWAEENPYPEMRREADGRESAWLTRDTELPWWVVAEPDAEPASASSAAAAAAGAAHQQAGWMCRSTI